MSLLDTLTNVFTGAPQQKAAQQQQDYANAQKQQVLAAINNAQANATNVLQTGQAGATGAITGGIDTARGDISSNTQPALNALYGGQDAAASLLVGGRGSALSDLQSGVQGATAAYDPLASLASKYSTQGGQYSQTVADALGLNGPEGYSRAISAFHTDPGYDFAVNQGLNDITRANNAAGIVASGNQMREAQTYGQGLADQQYQQWLKNVTGEEGQYLPLALRATTDTATGRANAALTGGTGSANIETGVGGQLANLYQGTGSNAANIYTGQGTSLADLASKGGLAVGGVDTGTAQNLASIIQGLTGQGTNYQSQSLDDVLNTYQQAANAQTSGSANLWNLGLNAAKLATGAGAIPGFGGAGIKGSYLSYPGAAG